MLLERKRREDAERRQQQEEMERILEENKRKVGAGACCGGGQPGWLWGCCGQAARWGAGSSLCRHACGAHGWACIMLTWDVCTCRWRRRSSRGRPSRRPCGGGRASSWWMTELFLR